MKKVGKVLLWIIGLSVFAFVSLFIYPDLSPETKTTWTWFFIGGLALIGFGQAADEWRNFQRRVDYKLDSIERRLADIRARLPNTN